MFATDADVSSDCNWYPVVMVCTEILDVPVASGVLLSLPPPSKTLLGRDIEGPGNTCNVSDVVVEETKTEASSPEKIVPNDVTLEELSP